MTTDTNDTEEIASLEEVTGEILSHAARLQEVHGRIASADTPEAKAAIVLELASELVETVMPLFAEFSKSALAEITDLRDEVFPVKLAVSDVEQLTELLQKTLPYVQANGALSAEVQEAVTGLQDVVSDDDDEDEDDEEAN